MMTMRKIQLILAALLTSIGIGAIAQQGPSLLPQASPPRAQTEAVPPALPTNPQLTAQDVEAWLDGYMPSALERGDVAGATVAVVKDGQLLFHKGYGFADVAKRVPVNSAVHLFRPGSVSKLFAWTAVMQQVEQGKLNLDADVNQYLDFKIPPFQGKPITLRNVMTHTAGFEEAIRDLITPRVPEQDLGGSLKRWIPERVYAPGSTPAYSNYATALAGYIVERASGMSFDDYLDRNIFAPLQMRNSSFRQPLPPQLMRNMSKGYVIGSDEAKPYEYVALAPAGSLAATAPDMANFMIAHLQGGAFGNARILRPETARTMHTNAYTVLPHLNRMVLGFYEHNVNGRRVIAHAGDTGQFHSELNLFLDDNVGIFVSVNSSGKEGAAGTIRTALFNRFADRYFPGEPRDGVVDAETAAAHARAIAGVYDNSRRGHSSFIAGLGLVSQAKVVEDGKGSILVPSLKNAGGAVIRWREIAPFVWREVGGETRLAAKVENGRVLRWSIDPISPFMVFDRTPWWRSTSWLMPLAYAALAALLLTVLLWPTAAIVRRRFGAPLALAPRRLWIHRGVRIAAVLALLVPVAWVLVVNSLFADEPVGNFKLLGAPALTLVALVGGLVLALWNAVLVWKEKSGRFARLWSVVLVLAFAILLWIALAFKLLSFATDF